MKLSETRVGGLYRISYPESMRFGSGANPDVQRVWTERGRQELLFRNQIIMMVDNQVRSGFIFVMDDSVFLAANHDKLEFEELTNATP